MNAHTLINQSIAPFTAIARQDLPAIAASTDWQGKYRILMNLGKQLPAFDNETKRDELLIAGCDSKAWLLHQFDTVTHQHYWAFDSEARVVKGMVALAICQLNGLSEADLAKVDFANLLKPLGIYQNISPSRQNGLSAVLAKMASQISAGHAHKAPKATAS